MQDKAAAMQPKPVSFLEAMTENGKTVLSSEGDCHVTVSS